MNTLIMVIGAKGSGKSEVMKILSDIGYYPVYNEDLYTKYGKMFPETNITLDDDTQNRIYLEVKHILREAVKRGNVCYESTGANPRWVNLKKYMGTKVNVIILKVEASLEIKGVRLKKRIWDNHYRPTNLEEHIAKINDEMRKIKANISVGNNGSINELRQIILRKLHENKSPIED